MPYTGITTRESTCAICNKAMPKGELVYFDPTKRQGKHLVHFECWETLRRERGPKPKPKSKTKPSVLSTEPLDPPF